MGVLEDIRSTSHALILSLQSVPSPDPSFPSHRSTFFSLLEQLDVKLKELNIRENASAIKERQLEQRYKKYVEKETECAKWEKKLEDREKEVRRLERRWGSLINHSKFNAKTHTPVTFTVRNQVVFTTSKGLILKFDDSLFEKLIFENDYQFSSTGKYDIPIDRDPVRFGYLLGVLHQVSMRDPVVIPSISRSEIVLLQQEFRHFGIPLSYLPAGLLQPNSTFAKVMKEWLPNREFKLLYRASVDGFAVSEFHRLCDNQGSTITLVQSKTGYIFGGYCVPPWTSDNSWKNHDEGFIFTLTNPHDIPPTMYHRNLQYKYAVLCSPEYGPVFGTGCDIAVWNNSHQNKHSFTDFTSKSYIDTTGKGVNTFTGEKYFSTTEVEVYAVV